MKHVAETFFNCQDCEDLVEPGDLVTLDERLGPICQDCADRRSDYPFEPGSWGTGDCS